MYKTVFTTTQFRRLKLGTNCHFENLLYFLQYNLPEKIRIKQKGSSAALKLSQFNS